MLDPNLLLWFRLVPDQPSLTQPASPAQPPSVVQPASQPTHPEITKSATICVKQSKTCFLLRKLRKCERRCPLPTRLPKYEIHAFSPFGDVTMNSNRPKLTPSMSTGHHSRGRQKQEFVFLIRFAISLLFGSSSDPKNKIFLTQTKIQFS